VLAYKVPDLGFPDYDNADIHEVLESHGAELTGGPLAIDSTEHEEDSDTIVDRAQLTTSAMKKGLQMVDDSADDFCASDHFTDWCLKFKHEMWALMAPYKLVCKDRHKVGQSKITLFSSLLSPPTMQSVSFTYPNNFQQGTPTFQ
jgi:hypothetical protein